jgi:hypothetical protein
VGWEPSGGLRIGDSVRSSGAWTPKTRETLRECCRWLPLAVDVRVVLLVASARDTMSVIDAARVCAAGRST